MGGGGVGGGGRNAMLCRMGSWPCSTRLLRCPLPNHHLPGIAEKLLWKSATLQGFFLLHYASQWRRHIRKLAGLVQAGRLCIEVRAHVVHRGSAAVQAV